MSHTQKDEERRIAEAHDLLRGALAPHGLFTAPVDGESMLLAWYWPNNEGPVGMVHVQYSDTQTVHIWSMPKPISKQHAGRAFLEKLRAFLPAQIHLTDNALVVACHVDLARTRQATHVIVQMTADLGQFLDYMATSLHLQEHPDVAVQAYMYFIEHRELGPEAAVDAVCI